MEEKINIAQVLKGKPRGTKLYSPICGECELSYIESEKFEPQIAIESEAFGDFYFWDDGKAYEEGECLLFPSYKMRDWSKFSWKPGDVLVGVGQRVIFEKFIDEDYTNFQGKYSLSTHEDRALIIDSSYYTSYFSKVNDSDNVNNYFEELEEKLGAKLNRETLEIEKPEFKDGDIVMSDSGTIVLVRGISLTRKIYYHAYMRNEYLYINQVEGEFFSRISRIKRFATDSEKQQLFDALAKEGKRWDSEHKMIVDLKPKVELKPFDKVLVRNTDTEEWFPGFFEKFDSTWNNPYHIMNRRSMTDFAFKQCIPYIGNESLLGTTNNVEG